MILTVRKVASEEELTLLRQQLKTAADYELGFIPKGVLVRIRYQSATPLDPTAREILVKVLEAQLKGADQ